MKTISSICRTVLALALLVTPGLRVSAAVLYVDQSSANPLPPYADWSSAARTIQDAVDAAASGDEIVVTNGVYATGGAVVSVMTNRVAVTKPVAVRSVNGPQVTTIQGWQVPGTTNGDSAVRGVYLGNGARLSGFTVTGGATRTNLDVDGGGVFCVSTNATLSNCLIVGNAAFARGAGVSSGTLMNCAIVGNTLHGTLAGASGNFRGNLFNCTVVGNSARVGSAAVAATLINCIVYHNTGSGSANTNYSSSTFSFSCTTPLPGAGVGNIAAVPQLASAWRLSANSPCRGAGSPVYSSGADLDGEPWASPPPIGCDEYWAGSLTGAISVAISPSALTVREFSVLDLAALIEGRVTASVWNLGDGLVASNRPIVSRTWSLAGDYPVTLTAYNESHPEGVTASVTVRVLPVVTHYVNADSANPVSPYLTWATAARTLQDAVDAAIDGEFVLVTNGIYTTGGRAIVGTMTNRVAITKALTVRSVNGPGETIIQGRQVPGTTNGDGAIRCAYLTNGATLSGFTLTGGATRPSGSVSEVEGGGVWCATNSAIVTNCVIVHNTAVAAGGGAVGGTLLECVVATNVAHGIASFGDGVGGGCSRGTLIRCSLIGNAAGSFGGGALSSTLVECLVSNNSAGLGGGAYGGSLRFCTISDNTVRVDPESYNGGGGAAQSQLFNCALTRNQSAYGGGAQYCALNNCVISANTAIRYGGGAWDCRLTNCTVTGNWADYGGGIYGGRTVNSIVYHNSARQSSPNYIVGIVADAMSYSCTFPSLTNGVGNITNEPALTSVSHLSAASPCRGAGNASNSTGVDIDGELWALPPSIGCDEYRTGSVTGMLSVAIGAPWTNTSPGFNLGFTAIIQGRTSTSVWDFGDGIVVTNQPYVSHAWNVPGDYPVVLTTYNESNPEGVRATLTVKIMEQPVHYVAVDSPNPAPPYTSWATAARGIQEAVDAAGHGGLVLVSNGVYATGGRTVFYTTGRGGVAPLINRVNVDRPLLVRSVNGPEVTVIQGANLIRCVYLTNGATLSGFTLTNGITSRDDYFEDRALQGGGAWCESTNAVLTNCLVTQCRALYQGGGVFSGTLYQCRLFNNGAEWGGGAAASVLQDCAFSRNSASSGGGAYECTLNRCNLSDNSSSRGGGAYGGTVTDSILVRNAASDGAGLASATAYNCTISGNRGIRGGGATSCTLNNCIVFYNIVTNAFLEAASGPNTLGGIANFSCIEPLPTNGTGNIARNPIFLNPASGNYRLAFNSPCLNAGNNAAVASELDLDLLPRIVGSTVDMGAYEFQKVLTLSIRDVAVLEGNTGSTDAVFELYTINTATNQYDAVSIDYATIGECATSGIDFVESHGTLTFGPGETNKFIRISVLGDTLDEGDETFVLRFSNPTNISLVIKQARATILEDDLVPVSVGAASVTEGNAGTSRLVFPLRLTRPHPLPVTVNYETSNGTAIDGLDYVSTHGNVTVLPGETNATISVDVIGDLLNEDDETLSLKLRSVEHADLISSEVVGTILDDDGDQRYVNLNNPNPVSPYLTWATAATNIQDAIDAALPNDEIVVTNGIYQTGGRAVFGAMTNRVAVTKPLTLRSVNGPEVTVIRGWQVPLTTNGIGAVRCLYLTNGASIIGFTLTNGATLVTDFDARLTAGGGVWCESTGPVLSNCVLVGNTADRAGGGGAYRGTLNNCTLVRNAVAGSGGGSSSSILNNCSLIENSARSSGGASILGLLRGCYIGRNTAVTGGGAYGASLSHCTLTENFASFEGGGTYACTQNNSIVYFNKAVSGTGSNYFGGVVNFTCTTPLPLSGAGNIAAEPLLASASRISPGSPCRGAGASEYAIGLDIDGEVWRSPPSMGCDEVHPESLTGPITVGVEASYTNIAAGYSLELRARLDGEISGFRWEFGDGVVVSNQLHTSHRWSNPGSYAVVLAAYNNTYPQGVTATATVQVVAAPVHFVAANSRTPVAPYLSWATAATNMQDAVDAATIAGATVLVSNGVYRSGELVIDGTTNRVGVTKPLILRSVNGPGATQIAGDGARCVYLADGASLYGFTLTNGIANIGGGLWCETLFGVASNCVVISNSASCGGGVSGGTVINSSIIRNYSRFGGGGYRSVLIACNVASNHAHAFGCNDGDCTDSGSGGGVYQCLVRDSTLSGNSSGYGGGAYGGELIKSLLSGNSAEFAAGAASCTLQNCILTGNSALIAVGGATSCTLFNSIVIGNVGGDGGGGLSFSTAVNCTVVGNVGRSTGVGAYSCTLNNCIVYYNVVTNGPGTELYGGVANYSCIAVSPTNGVGNFTNAPLFVDQVADNYRFQSTSPCINAGRNQDVPGSLDLDGNPRIVGGTVDVGAYEFQTPASVISYAWLQQFGLPIDGSADSVDTDGDGLNNQQEWRCGTVPTNSASVLRFLTPQPSESNVVLRWQSVAGQNYFLERSTNLSESGLGPFEPLVTNVSGQAGTTSYLDTNTPASAHAIYRLGVR